MVAKLTGNIGYTLSWAQFVSLAGSGHFTMTELCRDFGVSRKTGHKWVASHAEG